MQIPRFLKEQIVPKRPLIFTLSYTHYRISRKRSHLPSNIIQNFLLRIKTRKRKRLWTAAEEILTHRPCKGKNFYAPARFSYASTKTFVATVT